MLTDFKEPIWAHIELFGHKTYFGRIQEVTRFGVVGAAIEPMTAAGFIEPQFRGGAAIYGVTPMLEEDVRRAVMPRAWRACEAFKPSMALPDLCLTCGRNEPEHQEERAQIVALPPPATIPDAEVDGDDIPFERHDDAPLSGALGH